MATPGARARPRGDISVIEFHTLNSTSKAIDKPDRMIFDPDRGERTTWAHVPLAIRREGGAAIAFDYLRHGHGATTPAFWTWARPGLGVSMTLAWDEPPLLRSVGRSPTRGLAAVPNRPTGGRGTGNSSSGSPPR